MNERIREMAQEAGKYASVMTTHAKCDNKIASVSADTRSANEIFIETFAELIVKDCVKALNIMLRDMISRGEAADLILKHFGVEDA